MGRGWKQTAELTAPRPVTFGGFGLTLSVSADGSTALAGVTAKASLEKRVLRQPGETWKQTAVLTPSDGSSGDVFGRAVALSPDGTRAVIGAPTPDGRYLLIDGRRWPASDPEIRQERRDELTKVLMRGGDRYAARRALPPRAPPAPAFMRSEWRSASRARHGGTQSGE